MKIDNSSTLGAPVFTLVLREIFFALASKRRGIYFPLLDEVTAPSIPDLSIPMPCETHCANGTNWLAQ